MQQVLGRPASATDGEQAAHEVRRVFRDPERPPPLRHGTNAHCAVDSQVLLPQTTCVASHHRSQALFDAQPATA